MAKRKDLKEHKKLVARLSVFLEQNNYSNIEVDDLDDYKTPDKIGDSHIPDVTAEKSGTEYIFEVETADSIDDSHTREQWKTFAREAAGYEWKRFIVVPQGSKKDAYQRAFMLDLNIDDIREFNIK